ncbi:MAG: UvrD-helicase domain-containing protein [Coriobacteriales bacterium]|jgi:superfamily I DNA/RNA helicase|nr:UvrD-helicase domain-containing protein [Coriobacteriales bacterium]
MSLTQINLTQSQRAVIELPANNPIQIKGVAGSGKTTVALYRAMHLMQTQSTIFREANVAIFAYNKVLVTYINALVKQLGMNITVINFHRWAHDFMVEHGIQFAEDNPEHVGVTVASDAKRTGLVHMALNEIKELSEVKPLNEASRGSVPPLSAGILVMNEVKPLNEASSEGTAGSSSHNADFYVEEISWIKGKAFNDMQEYLNAKRVGRGTTVHVTYADREFIWKVYLAYNKQLLLHNMMDFDDFALQCLKILDEQPLPQKPFTHIVIDEAQDLTKAAVMVLARLVDESTQSITLVADAAQRIFKSGFTWSEAGINIRGGRTVELKRSYRCPGPIANAAISLLSKESDKSDFTQMEIGRLGGNKPVLGLFKNPRSQMDYLLTEIKALQVSDSLSGTIVLCRAWTGVGRVEKFLEQNGVRTQRLKDNEALDFLAPVVMVCTMSSIKGLEFNNVFICDLNDDDVPFPCGFGKGSDDEHISLERRLLFTAMTRARERLYMLSSAKPSRYILEIDHSYLNIINVDTSASLAANAKEYSEMLERAKQTGQVLYDLLNIYPDVLSDDQRLRGLLNDSFPADKARCYALLKVYDEKIFLRLTTLKQLQGNEVEQMAKQLSLSVGLRPEVAAEAIYGWAFMLKLNIV